MYFAPNFYETLKKNLDMIIYLSDTVMRTEMNCGFSHKRKKISKALVG